MSHRVKFPSRHYIIQDIIPSVRLINLETRADRNINCTKKYSDPYFFLQTVFNKKVLLRERKRHTARHVASARYVPGQVGYPVPGLGGYIVPCLGGTSSQVRGGVPCPRSRGVPHPDLVGVPPPLGRPGMG